MVLAEASKQASKQASNLKQKQIYIDPSVIQISTWVFYFLMWKIAKKQNIK